LNTRNLIRWAIYLVLAILVAVFLYNQMAARQTQATTISMQDLASAIKAGKVAKIVEKAPHWRSSDRTRAPR